MASVKWTPEKGRKKVKGKIRWRVKRPDGTWQEHSATYSAKDGPDWQRQLHEHLARIEAGKDPTQAAPARSAMTVGELVERWYEGRVVSAGARRTYRIQIKRIPDWLLALRVDEWTPVESVRARRELEAGWADNSARATWAVLRSVARLGMEWDLIERDPLRGVPPPRRPVEEAGRALTLEECRRLVPLIERDPLCGLWWLLLAGGLRIGEALALRWEDVDLAAGVVQVRATVTREGNEEVVKPTTKTGRGRLVALDTTTAAALARQRAAQGPAARWVCDHGDGRRVHSETARRRLRRLAEDAGIAGRVTPHDLRRSMASGFGELRASPKLISERLGHTTVAMTAKYDRPSLEGQRSVAEEFVRRVRGD